MNPGWMKRVVLNLIYPRRARCLGCGDMTGCDRDDLCEDCRSKLAGNWVGVCRMGPKSKIDGAAFAYRYAGPAGGLTRNLKYRGVWMLAEGMGAQIARAAELLRLGKECVVTSVPMHPRRQRRRGRNHAELLARHVAGKLGLEYRELLMRTWNAPQQARLNREQRAGNLRGGFAVRSESAKIVEGAQILLIDDVYTTGATAESCADALRKAGAARVYLAAFADGERKKNG